jgi:hypothetical protein
MTKRKSIEVFIPHGYKPKKVEIEAALILAQHHKTSVQILRPTMGYKEKTPDFQIGKDFYELKTPISAKAEKIKFLIREATKQSENVVIDARKTKIHEKHLEEICQDRLKHIKKLKHITLIIDKKKVIDFTERMR